MHALFFKIFFCIEDILKNYTGKKSQYHSLDSIIMKITAMIRASSIINYN